MFYNLNANLLNNKCKKNFFNDYGRLYSAKHISLNMRNALENIHITTIIASVNQARSRLFPLNGFLPKINETNHAIGIMYNS